MQIELIGVTGAGKTTLAREMVQVGSRLGIPAQLCDGFILEKIRMDWVRNEFLRRRLVEMASLFVCFISWRKYRQINRFIINNSLHTEGTWTYRLNLARNGLRKIGIYEFIKQAAPNGSIILLDNEGVLQAAHALFAHPTGSWNIAGLEGFARLAPLPDVVAYISQPESVLVERTLRRGHNRVFSRSQEAVQNFIRQAVDTFEELRQASALRDRLLIVETDRQTISADNESSNASLAQAAVLFRETLSKKYSHSCKLQNAAGNGADRDGTSFDDAPRTLPLVKQLIDVLNRRNIRYCHWKSNLELPASLNGDNDLDLLVARERLPDTLTALSQLGFKEAIPKWGSDAPAIAHYYGLDPQQGQLVHVHLFSSVVTGQSAVKSHHLPFENMLLDNGRTAHGVKLPSFAAELVLFVMRHYIKYGSPLDWPALVRASDALREELRWLLNGCSLSDTLALLRQYCPTISEDLFLNCINAIDEDQSFVRRWLLALKVRRRLSIYAKQSFLSQTAANARAIAMLAYRRLRGHIRAKILHSSGAVIAVVGPDATGKSTLVAESRRWLGQVVAVRPVHLGKPPSSWITAPINLLIRLRRGLVSFPSGAMPGVTPEGHASNGESHPGDAPQKVSLVFALRAVALAWDRRKLAVAVRRAAAQGIIVFCDRYPSKVLGAMDGPRLPQRTVQGARSRFYRFLVRTEQRIYASVPPPDVVLNIRTSLNNALQRNGSRANSDKDSDEFVQRRHNECPDWRSSGALCYFNIDNDSSLEQTIADVKEAIWTSL